MPSSSEDIESPSPPTPQLAVVPYVPLARSEAVGPWTLVPFGQVLGHPSLPDELADHVLGLIGAYELPFHGAGIGALAVPAEGRIGARFDPAALPVLSAAMLAGVISSNPALAVPEDQRSDGWGACTSENSLAYGHNLVDPRSYALGTGMLITVTSLRHADEEGVLPRIEAPVELPTPLWARFDQELADATLTALTAGTDASRRLGQALDWYRVAFSNAHAVPGTVRVGAVRSAFELLLNVSSNSGDKTKKLVNRLGRALDDRPAPPTIPGSHPIWRREVLLTAEQWWLLAFTDTRNAIVHGDALADDMWLHEGIPHLAHAHDLLIRLLRCLVAGATEDEDLRLPMSERIFARPATQMLDRLRRDAEPDT